MTVRVLYLFLFASVVICGASWATGDSGTAKKPLDLPSGGARADADEDAPETILFYGTELEGDAFFWCLDKGGSMAWGGKLNALKAEVTAALQSLSPGSQFGIVAFSTSYILWSPQPERATTANKASAVEWVNALTASGWTCLREAAIKTLEISDTCAKKSKSLIILTDGAPVCNGVDTSEACLNDITAANWQHTPINTVSVCDFVCAGCSLLHDIAQANGGVYTAIHED